MSAATENANNIYTNIDSLRRLQHLAKGFSFLPNQPVNSILSGMNVSKLRGRGLNFEELRHYRPGDDIRSMDWKVTRRTGKPHIKVYTEERERNVYLVVDQRSNMFFGSTHKMKSVIAAELAALMAFRITDSSDRVGAVVYNNSDIKIVPAKRGRQHVINVLSEIVRQNNLLGQALPPDQNKQVMSNVLAKLSHVCGNNALVILISDGAGWDKQCTEYIKRIRQHNEIIACHISDPLEQKLPQMSQMVVSDGELQIQFSSHDKNFQNKYQTEIKEQLVRYTNTTRKYRIPLLSVSTILPVEQQIRKAFGRAKE